MKFVHLPISLDGLNFKSIDREIDIILRKVGRLVDKLRGIKEVKNSLKERFISLFDQQEDLCVCTL